MSNTMASSAETNSQPPGEQLARRSTRREAPHRKCRPLKTALVLALALVARCSTPAVSQLVEDNNNRSRNLQIQQINEGNTTKLEDDMMKLPLYMRTLATLACLIIFTIGVCGNLLVPLVVIKTKYLRNSTNLFLINLSVADLLVLIVCMPTVLIELHSRPETWLLGEPMCKLSNFIEMLAANGSIFTILAISFERYYAICKPLKAGYKCTRLRATIIICLIWLLASVLTSPILIIAKSSETIYIDGSLVYNCILETDTYWHKMYVFVSMFAFFCLPLIVLMLVYWLIGRRLIRENLAMSTTSQLAASSSSSTSCNQRTTTDSEPSEQTLGGHSASFRPAAVALRKCVHLESGSSSLKSTLASWLAGSRQKDEQCHSYCHCSPRPLSAADDVQIRRPKQAKAYSLDNQHLFSGHKTAERPDHCHQVADESEGRFAGEHSLESNTTSNMPLIDLHKFMSRLFRPRLLRNRPQQAASKRGNHYADELASQQMTSQAIKAANGELDPSDKHKPRFEGSNGFMMQAINEQPAGGKAPSAEVATGSELSNDELGSQAPFLGRCRGNERAACAITNHRKQLHLGSSLSGVGATQTTVTNRHGLLRRSTESRRQLAKDPTVSVGSKFTRWAKRFSLSSSSTSMLTTTSTALPSEIDCVLSLDQQQHTHESNTFVELEREVLAVSQHAPLDRPITSYQSTASNDYAPITDFRKYSKKLINRASGESVAGHDEKQSRIGDIEKCTRFGSVSTTNCSSPIPSSSNISEASATSPYSSSKSPSPDLILAGQHRHQKQLRISSHVEEMRECGLSSKAKRVESLSVEAPSDILIAETARGDVIVTDKPNFGPQAEKLTKVQETAYNWDRTSSASKLFPDVETQVVEKNTFTQLSKKRNKSVSKQLLVNNIHADLNTNSKVNKSDVSLTKKRLGQLRDEHKSLDIDPIHHQSQSYRANNNNNHQHHNHHHFHFNLKRSNKRSGSQPVVYSNHLSGQNSGNGTKLSELLVVQDLSKKQQMDSRRQVVIMLAFVVACFFLLFFPYRVFTIWLILSTEAQVQSLGMETYYNLTYFSRILIYLHSAINPIAYNLISTKFRRAFMSILLCRGSSSRRHFTTEHRIINRRMTLDDHHKSLKAANQTR